LPNFLIVGDQKCETSSLHHYLANHPSVWSLEKKVLHFFNYDYSVPFYKRFFRNQPCNIADLLVGEATPEYIFHPYSAEGERIKGDLYKMSADKNFYGCEWNHHSYLLIGHYSHQIENWLLHFKNENLLVLSAERLFSNTKKEFKKV